MATLIGTLDGAPGGWATEEYWVRLKMRKALSDHIGLARDIERFTFDSMVRLSKPTQPQSVLMAHSALLVRTLQDLRAAVITGMAGYTMQSWTNASSCFEAAYTMGFIGSDSKRADRWLAHADPSSGFVAVKDAVIGTYRYLEIGESQAERADHADRDYGLYVRLCAGKHANPMAERHRYWVEHADGVRLFFTPLFDRIRVRQAEFGLVIALRATIVALLAFTRTHWSREAKGDPEMVELAKRIMTLMEPWLEKDGPAAPIQ